MKFEYQIPRDEYVAGQCLYFALSGGRNRVYKAVTWILIGVFFLIVVWNERNPAWSSFLLSLMGLWWIYAGIVNIYPAWHFRRAYRRSKLAGTIYTAEVSGDELDVTGQLCSWRARWSGVHVKGEDNRVFMFYAANTIFIFGKKYLNHDQQEQLRQLSGISLAKN